MEKNTLSKNLENSIGKDINDVKIDTSKAADERIEEYIEQIHNPYCFKCDKTLVRVMFNPKGNNLESSMLNYFSRLNEI